MWFLPTFNRPQRCQVTLDSIGAAGSSPGIVIVNGGDDYAAALRLPPHWRAIYIEENRGVSSALQFAFAAFPDEPWYGFITDDSLVRTSMPDGFDAPLIAAAGRTHFAHSDDLWQTPGRMHGAVVFGGDLLRAIGWWSAPGLRHSFTENVWERIAIALGNWRYVPEVVVEHLHPDNRKAADDATYSDAYSSFEADKAAFFGPIKLKEIPAAVARTAPVVWASDKPRARLARAKARKVMIGTPCARAAALEYTLAFADTCVHLDRSGIGFASQFVIGSSNLPRARNEIVARFLASDCTDLVFIDDDMGWKPEALVRLLASDQQVIAGVGRKKVDKPNSDPEVWCFGAKTLDANLRVPPQDAMGAIEVAAVGTAFMKIERSVFEAMIAAHPEWKRDGHDGMAAEVRKNYYQFFRFDPDDTIEMGEDYVFCKRWRDLGGSIWIDPAIELSHVGSNAWSGCISELLMRAPEELERAA